MPDAVPPTFWIGFLALILVLLSVDLFVLHRGAASVSVRSAALTSAFWIGLGLGFGLLVLAWRGPDLAVQYFSGYLIEESLSIDNVFVFSLIFTAFAVPREHQHRVLFWGVIGALAMRLVMIVVGAALIERFGWILAVFGAFLILTGIRMWRSTRREGHPDPASNPLVRAARRLLPVSEGYDGGRFFTRVGGRRAATPLLLALLVVEVSDLVFAVDSIPAVFAVSRDPFVVYTSNAFAILGLRSLYFFLADLRERFRYLTHGLAIVLVFVGAKLLLAEWLHLAPWVSLLVIVGVLGASIAISVRASGRAPAASPSG